jgi:CRISPR-associated protein Csh2
MLNEFKTRIFGAIILKSINSNFNADFTHHPRTLPDGVVYATDKALKYAIKDYFRKLVDEKKLFYVKRFNDKLNPLSLNDTYKFLFKEYPKAPVEKFALFYFDGEQIKGVLPKPKKKQITDYFKGLPEDSTLKECSQTFEILSGKDISTCEVQEIKKPDEETEFYFCTDKEKKIIKLEGELNDIEQISKELDPILTGGIDRFEVLRNLLGCLDVRLFGATFAGETNISIHGPVQINHGVNKFPDNDIYTEDILSPFRNEGEAGSDEKGASTIGNQTNLKEGHYIFHFSINPKNTEEFYSKINNSKNGNSKLFLSDDDISTLKEAFNNSVTALDSSRKMGTENEATIWIQLTEGSKKMLPGLTELIEVKRNSGKVEIDCKEVKTNIGNIDSDVKQVEVYYNPSNTNIIGLDKGGKIKHFNILNNQEIQK